MTDLHIRPVADHDIGDIVRIDEKLGGEYRPEVWERRIGYCLRRDPEASLVAELDGRLVGFMLGELRTGEFGLEEPTGWIEVLGVDPDHHGQAVGRRLGQALVEHFRSRGATCVRTLVETSRRDIEGFFIALGFGAASLKPLVKAL